MTVSALDQIICTQITSAVNLRGNWANSTCNISVNLKIFQDKAFFKKKKKKEMRKELC